MKNQHINLPIVLQKDVTSLFQYSLPLCAILAYPHMNSWYLGKYLDIVGKYSSNDTVWFWTYDAVDYVEKNVSNEIFCFNFFDMSFCKSNFCLQSFILNSLNFSNYLIIFCDEFFIPTSSHYNINHFVHEYLIYGYNSSTFTINCIGFNKKGTYDTLEINLSDLNNAFLSALTQYHENNSLIHKKAIISFKIPSDPLIKDYNSFSKIKYKLKQYFLSSLDIVEIQTSAIYKSPLAPNEQLVYGINTYYLLIHAFKSLKQPFYQIDLRLLLLLLEIKKSILLRLGFLQQQKPKLSPLIHSYQKEIINKFEMLKLHFIKASKTTNDNRFLINSNMIDQKTIDKFVNTINNIRLAEERIIKEIINLL